jgi:hypothetical protein
MEFLIFLVSVLIIGVLAWLVYKRVAPKKPRILVTSATPAANTGAHDEYEFDASEYEDELDDNEHDPDDKNDEFWTQYGMPAVTTLRFTYEDGAGKRSERLVDVKLFAESAWGPQLIGHCHTRNATRTFKVDRIKNCVDETSNTNVEDVYDHLCELYEKTPEYSYEGVLEKSQDMLRALLYIMEYSGHQEHQRAIVLTALCKKWSGDERIETRHVAPFVVQHRRASIQAFRLIAGRISKSLAPSQQPGFLALASKLATQFGPTNSYNQEALDYLAKRFAKPE